MQLKPEVMIITPPEGKKMAVLREIIPRLYKVKGLKFRAEEMPNGKDIVVLIDCGEDRAKWGEIRNKVEKAVGKAIKECGLTAENCPGIWKD